MKFFQNKKIKNTVYRTRYTPERFKKIKEQGFLLNIGGTNYKLKDLNEPFKASYKKPKITAFEAENDKTRISFVLPEDVDRVFIDYKEIKRYGSKWVQIVSFDDLKKEKEYSYEVDLSKGLCRKYRITYTKGNHVRFEDFILEDNLFKFFYDAPELAVHKRDNIKLTIFNLKRFAKNGYIRIFKKENLENEECIFSSEISSEIIDYVDNNVSNHSFYYYRAEVYDNLGNSYKTETVKIETKHRGSVLQKDASKSEETGLYEIQKKDETTFTIERYNLLTETIESIETIDYSTETQNCDNLEKNGIYFSIPERDGNYVVQIEGYDSDGYLVSWSELSSSTPVLSGFSSASVKKNSKNQNIIYWQYTGNVDTFVVASKSKIRSQVVDIVSHRVSPEGYIYCIDDNYAKERVSTEYVINAVDEFGNIANKARIKVK